MIPIFAFFRFTNIKRVFQSSQQLKPKLWSWVLYIPEQTANLPQSIPAGLLLFCLLLMTVVWLIFEDADSLVLRYFLPSLLALTKTPTPECTYQSFSAFKCQVCCPKLPDNLLVEKEDKTPSRTVVKATTHSSPTTLTLSFSTSLAHLFAHWTRRHVSKQHDIQKDTWD